MSKIHHVVEYLPYYIATNQAEWRERFPDTWKILDFKDGKQTAVQHYTGLVEEHLSKALDLGSDWGIVIVPSSKKDKWGAGLLSVAQSVSQNHGVCLHSKALRRHHSTEKRADGGDRAIAKHLGTITLSESSLPNKIILLDDVTSTGNSLVACRDILLRSGIKEVYMLAIAETVHE